MGVKVSVDRGELDHVVSILRDGGRELTRVGIDMTTGMPAMTPTLEYETYHELRNIALQLEKVGRELFLDAAAQEMRLVEFGKADRASAIGVVMGLAKELAVQAATIQTAGQEQLGLEAVLNPIDRAEHFVEGAVDFGADIVGAAWQLAQSTTEYGLVDPQGHKDALEKDKKVVEALFKASPAYLMWNPSDSLRTDAAIVYSLVGGKYIWEGDGDKWLGNVVPQVAIGLMTDGAGEVAVAPVEVRAPATAAGLAAAPDAALAAASADAADVSFLAGRVAVPGITRERPLLGLKDAWDALNNFVTVNTAPVHFPWEPQAVPAQ